jgi:hypothetical protein
MLALLGVIRKFSSILIALYVLFDQNDCKRAKKATGCAIPAQLTSEIFLRLLHSICK